MQRRNEDAYRLPLILFSAKSNEFDHYFQQEEEVMKVVFNGIRSLQTLRYEYRLKLYQSMNHQVVELLDQRVNISIVYLIVETTGRKKTRKLNFLLFDSNTYGKIEIS